MLMYPLIFSLIVHKNSIIQDYRKIWFSSDGVTVDPSIVPKPKVFDTMVGQGNMELYWII